MIMKKKYSKPGIIIEDFVMAQNIATNCGNGGFGGTKHTYADKYNCGWYDGDVIVFATEPTCEDVRNPDLPSSNVCYNNPNPGEVIFGSY